MPSGRMKKCCRIVAVIGTFLFFALTGICCAATVAADSLRGYVVLGADGVPVGKVEEVLIDLEQGRLSYLQVAAGSDSRQVFVPWRAVRIGSQPPAVRLSIGAEKFRLAPSGEVVFADREEERAFHRFFGVSPYWEGDPAVSPPRPPRNLRIVK